MMMGSVYLAYSAYYVSLNVPEVKTAISVIINLLYLLLFIVIIKNSVEVLYTLRINRANVSNNGDNPMRDVINLKISMIKKFIYIITVFFAYELVVHGIIPIMNQDSEFNIFKTVMHQVVDYLICVALLVTYRPREWPDYFNLGIAEDPFFGIVDDNE